MNVLLFTIISLMLSICGAGYAAITAFRNYFHESIRMASNEAPRKVETLLAEDSSPDAKKFAKSLHCSMKQTSFVWSVAHWIIIVAFLIFAFGIASYAVTQWPNLGNQGEILWAPLVIKSIMGINLMALIAAIIALVAFKSSAKQLDSQWRQHKQRTGQDAGITPTV